MVGESFRNHVDFRRARGSIYIFCGTLAVTPPFWSRDVLWAGGDRGRRFATTVYAVGVRLGWTPVEAMVLEPLPVEMWTCILEFVPLLAIEPRRRRKITPGAATGDAGAGGKQETKPREGAEEATAVEPRAAAGEGEDRFGVLGNTYERTVGALKEAASSLSSQPHGKLDVLRV